MSGHGASDPTKTMSASNTEGNILALSGYEFAYGTYEEALSMVGTTTAPRAGDVDVNWTTIKQFCSAVEDPNPSYWDPDLAEELWGSIVAPPAMLMVWTMHLRWKPDHSQPAPLLMGQVPLPGDVVVNVSNDTEFYVPVRLSDRLTVTEEVTDVSAEKCTRVGTGHFVTTVSTFCRQDGAIVAQQTNVLFRGLANQEPVADIETGADR
jgi:uncharacterized protein